MIRELLSTSSGNVGVLSNLTGSSSVSSTQFDLHWFGRGGGGGGGELKSPQ